MMLLPRVAPFIMLMLAALQIHAQSICDSKLTCGSGQRCDEKLLWRGSQTFIDPLQRRKQKIGVALFGVVPRLIHPVAQG